MILNDWIARLAAFEPNGFPVLSLYLNTEPDERGRDNYGAWLRKELNARARTFPAGSSERESFDKDAERIGAFLEKELKPATNGLVIFACAGAGLFEAMELATGVGEHRLYVYNQPHLYQLARLNDEYPRYAAVITDTNTARLYVFGLGQVLTEQQVKNEKTKSVKVGGWSQARYRRRVENSQNQHAREVIEILDHTVREEGINHIVLAGDEVIVPKLREALPQHLADKVIDVLRLDINAPETEVLNATLEAMRAEDAKDDAGKVKRLLNEYRAGGLAVVGRDYTMAALDIGQVDELVVSAALERNQQAAGTGATIPEEAAAADELVTKAAQTGAAVTFIEDAELLAPAGGVGAFLRYRI